eukprot:g14874.t1
MAKNATGLSPAPTVVAIVGASGGVGCKAVECALAQGFVVKVLVRSAEKLAKKIGQENVQKLEKVVLGSVDDEAAVRQLLEGVSVVLSCLGTAYGERHSPVVAAGTAKILKQMEAGGVKSLVMISSLGEATKAKAMKVHTLHTEHGLESGILNLSVSQGNTRSTFSEPRGGGRYRLWIRKPLMKHTTAAGLDSVWNEDHRNQGGEGGEKGGNSLSLSRTLSNSRPYGACIGTSKRDTIGGGADGSKRVVLFLGLLLCCVGVGCVVLWWFTGQAVWDLSMVSTPLQSSKVSFMERDATPISRTLRAKFWKKCGRSTDRGHACEAGNKFPSQTKCRKFGCEKLGGKCEDRGKCWWRGGKSGGLRGLNQGPLCLVGPLWDRRWACRQSDGKACDYDDECVGRKCDDHKCAQEGNPFQNAYKRMPEIKSGMD